MSSEGVDRPVGTHLRFTNGATTGLVESITEVGVDGSERAWADCWEGRTLTRVERFAERLDSGGSAFGE